MLQRFALRTCTTAFVGLLTMGLAQAQVTFTDDFNDGDDANWTRYKPLSFLGLGGTYSFENGGYRIQTTPTPEALLPVVGVSRAGSGPTDFLVRNFVWFATS